MNKWYTKTFDKHIPTRLSISFLLFRKKEYFCYRLSDFVNYPRQTIIDMACDGKIWCSVKTFY